MFHGLATNTAWALLNVASGEALGVTRNRAAPCSLLMLHESPLCVEEGCGKKVALMSVHSWVRQADATLAGYGGPKVLVTVMGAMGSLEIDYLVCRWNFYGE